ncbi:hypothetical protein ACIG3E_37290 [Streptomyces sp. NPDC053474]|uniref:hypothetical protein n=1 Tax=Streptomyces sp. NPDC053474 TaxID=3365704 RepID=UPI0037CF1629
MANILTTMSREAGDALRDAVSHLDGAAPARDTWRRVLAACTQIDSERFLADFLDASQDPDVFRQLADGYDEKESCLRLRLTGTEALSVRLHIWTPPPPGQEPYLENVHGHRRYMVSSLIAGAYLSDDYDYHEEAEELSPTGRRILGAGTCYLIAPETVHAVANPFPRHCVSLIYRGGSVTDRILIFDRDRGRPAAYTGVRPVGDLGKTTRERAMSRTEYLRYRLDRIRAESAAAPAPR